MARSSISKDQAKTRRKRPVVEGMEPRILFSADGLSALLGSDLADDTLMQDAPPVILPVASDTQHQDIATPANDAIATPTIATELVVVDSRVADYQRLVEDIQARSSTDAWFEIIVLNQILTGIEQITDLLAQRQDVSALHIISHGADGGVQLGSGWVDAEALERQGNALMQWRDALTADADILVYGCDVAEGSAGQMFVQQLAQLTGADVAASTNATGDAAFGADWVLEYQSGEINIESLFEHGTPEWSGVLAVSSIGTNSSNQTTGATSLTWTHTVSSGSNLALIVGVAIDGLGANVTSVTYGSATLTQVGRATGNHAVELWSLVNPTVGANTVTINFGGTTAAAGGAMTFSGVNQSTPTGTFAGAAGTGTTSSVTVSSATGDLVVDIENWDNNPSGYAVGAGQTQQWTATNASIRGVSTTEAGAASVIMSSTVTSSAQWEIGAVSLRAAANAAPTATNLSAAETYTEDTALNLINIVASDADSPNITATLTLSNVAAGSLSTATSGAVTSTYSALTGVWTASGAIADVNTLLAGVTFNPATNFNSNFTIATSISDGVAPAITGSKAMTGTAVNEPPVNTVPGAQTTNEDVARVFSSANGNPISITDVDAGANPVEVSVSVTNGTLTLAGTAGLTFVNGDGTADASMTIRGTVASINTALNGLTYSPNANYNGGAVLTVSTLESVLVSLSLDANLQGRYEFNGDANDTSPGTFQHATLVNGATLSTDVTRGQVLTLDGVNDYAQITGVFSNPTEVTIGGWVNISAAGAVRREFISLSDRVHIALNEAGNGIKGSVQVGAASWVDLTSGQFFTTGAWHHVMYTFSDSGNVHSLYIDGVRVASASIASSIYWTGATDTFIGRHPSAGNFLAGQVDDIRIYDRALNGTEVASLANDLPLRDTDTVAITVNPVNDAPVSAPVTLAPIAENSGARLITQAQLLANATDIEGSALTAIGLTIASGSGSLVDNGNGTWSYTPALNDDTSVVFSYNVSDGSLAGGGSATMDITPVVNNPPVGVADSYTVNEDNTLTVSWWDNDWTRRSAISLSGNTFPGATNLADFPVLIQLNSGNIDYSLTQNAGQDLRFVDANGAPLAYEIEKWNEAGDSYVWVRVPQVDTTGTDQIFMYYGNAAASAEQNSGAVWSNSYSAVYHLGGTGNAIVDSTGNGITGTATNGPVTGAGQVGDARVFDGVNDYVNLGSNRPLIDGANAITYSAWVNPASIAGTGTESIISSSINNGGVTTGTSRFALERIGANLQVIVRADDATSFVANTTSNPLVAGTWKHIAVTVDVVTDTLLIYVDGVLQPFTSTGSLPGAAFPNTPSASNAIGAADDGTGIFFNGQIDEVRVAEAARSAAWVQAEHLNMTNGFVTVGAAVAAPAVGGVLANDSDDGTLLSAVLVSGPSNAASFTLNPDGTFNYTPVANFNGTDTFVYRASDGALSSADVTVTITVNPVNDAPVNTVPGSQTATEDTALAIAGISIADVDAGGASLTTQLTVASGQLNVSLAGGASISAGANNSNALTLSGTLAQVNAALVTLTYQGNLNFAGVDTLQVLTNDLGNTGAGGALTDTDMVAITVNAVNDSPTIGGGFVPAIAEDTVNPPGQTISAMIGASFSDPDAGATLAGVLITNNPQNAAQGAWQYSTNGGTTWFDVGAIAFPNALALDAATRIRFLPVADYNGNPPDILSFRGLDNTYAGGFTSGATKVTFDASSPGGGSPISSSLVAFSTAVTAVNDAPVATVPGSAYSATEQVALDLKNTGLSVSDVDAASGSITVTLSVGQGVLNVTAGGSGAVVGGSGTGSVTITGNINQINNLLNIDATSTVSYFNGLDAPAASTTLTLNVNDGGNTGSGGALSDIENVTINIASVNDAPVNTVPGAQTVNEDTALSIAGLSIADADASASSLTTQLTVTNGRLNVSLAGGAVISAGANDSNTLTLSGTQTQINAALATLTYQGNANFNGADTLQIVTDDLGNTGAGGARSDTDTVAITVNAVNDAPVASGSSSLATVAEDTLSPGGASVSSLFGTNFSDVADAGNPGQNQLAGVAVRGQSVNAAQGRWQYSIDGGGSWNNFGALSDTNALALRTTDLMRFLPAADYNGTPTNLTVRLIDNSTVVTGGTVVNASTNGGTTPFSGTTVTLGTSISAVNDAPVFSGLDGTPGYTENAAPVVLDGNVTIGDVELTAANNFNGATLTLLRNGGANTQDVFSATGTLSPLIDEGSLVVNGITIGGVLQNANGTLILVFSSNATGALVNQAMQQIAYSNTSDAPSAGVQISWTFSDGNSGAQGSGGALQAIGSTTVSITAVNDAPTATIVPVSYAATEQVVLTLHGTGLSIADVDAGAAAVRATVSVTSGALTAAAGTTGVFISGSGTNTVTLDGTLTQINDLLAGNLSGTLTYAANSDTPAASDTLTLTASDLGNSGSGGTLTGNDTATINITAVNDAPVNTVPGAQTVNEDDVLSIGGLSIVDVDAGASNLSTQLTVSNGRLNVSLAGGATISAGANNSNTLTLLGTQMQINAALATLTYQGNLNFNGADTLQVVTNDLGNTGTGGAQSDTDTVAITVNAVNDGPSVIFGEGSKTFTEGALAVMIDALATVSDADSPNFDTGTLVVTISANVSADDRVELLNTGMGAGQIGVSGVNVYYGGTLIGTQAGGIGTSPFAVTFNASADATAVREVMRNIRFWVASDAPSTAVRTVDVVLTDGDGGTSLTATKQISVVAVNDAPVNTVPGAQTVNEDSTLAITGLSVNDVDAGGAGITTHLSVANGTLNVSLAGGASISAGANGSGTLTLSGTQAQINAALATLSYQGNLNFNGIDSLQIVTNDLGNTGSGGAQSDTDTVAITVNAVNDGPVNTVPGAQTVNEDTALSIAGISVNDVDGNLATTQLTVSNGTLNVSLAGGATINAGANGSSTLTLAGSQAQINAALATLTYQGNLNYNGSDTLTVLSTDGSGASDSDNVAITVTAQNDAPVNAVPGPQTVNEDAPLTIVGVSVNDVDGNLATTQLTVGNGTINLSLAGGATISAGANGSNTLTLSGTQAQINAALATLSYQSNLDFNGIDTLTVLSVDGAGAPLSDSDTVTITVVPVNDAPTTSPVTLSPIAEDSGARIITQAELLGNATDVDGPALTASNLALMSGAGTLVDNGNGTWTYIAAANDDTGVSFSYSLSDGNLATAGLATLDITPVNDAALITGVTSGTVIEAGGIDNAQANVPEFSGRLFAFDVDNAADTFIDQPAIALQFGEFQMTTGGLWTYTLNNNQPDVQALNGGDTLNETVTVRSIDGTAQQLTIVIAGRNDAAAISGATTGAVTGSGTSTVSGVMQANDVDNAPAFQPVGPAAALFGTYQIGANGHWTYRLDPGNAAVSALGAGAALTDSFTARTLDNTPQVVSITIVGSGSGPGTGATSGETVSPSGVSLPLLPPTIDVQQYGTPAAGGTPTSEEVGKGATRIALDRLSATGELFSALGVTGDVESNRRGLTVSAHTALLLQGGMGFISKLSLAERLEDFSLTLAGYDFGEYTFQMGKLTLLNVNSGRGSGPSALDIDLAESGTPDGRERDEFTANVLRISGMSLTLGIAAWALRSGGLLAAMMSALPVWRQIDVLPILGDPDKRKVAFADESDETAREERALERVFDGRARSRDA